MEGCKLPEVAGVHVGTVLYQQFRHLEVPVRAGVVQRHQSSVKNPDKYQLIQISFLKGTLLKAREFYSPPENNSSVK